MNDRRRVGKDVLPGLNITAQSKGPRATGVTMTAKIKVEVAYASRSRPTANTCTPENA
jgi:hypothetical protein